MSWKTVKNFLIVLLTAVNFLLFFFAYNYFKNSQYTSEDTANEASQILAQSNISISPEQLAVKHDSAEILRCEYNREDYLEFVSALLFGKEADNIYLLPDGIRAETLSGESALLGFDMAIDFKNAVLKTEIDNAIQNQVPISDENSKAVRTSLEKQLALATGALDNAKCEGYGEYFFITVNQCENDLPIYDMTCVFGLKGDKVVYANGKHFFAVPSESESAQLLSRVNIMFSEKQRGEEGKVSDISLCYTLYEDPHNNRMLYIPAYKITYAGGKVSAVNAISKEKY
ncbi:MAG: hypothetical protein IJC81_00810 [Clostridia bacterium]|nr:hypothetical protein [Clostridia bacterium]